MTTGADPHRVLGVPRGANAAEIKRAYRALAKQHHPDAAGQASLPRFLEIQAAYEALIGSPAPGGPGGAGASGASGGAGARGARDGAGASRASGVSGTWARPAQPGSGRTPGSEGGAGSGRSAGSGRGATDDAWTSGTWARRDSGRTAGTGPRQSSGAGAEARRRSERPDRSERPRPERSEGAKRSPKATLGSTSYDGADPAADAHWDGASWYGASSGEYWTVNPREYADPRKHGPEYQERARRNSHHRIHGRPSARSAQPSTSQPPPPFVATEPEPPTAPEPEPGAPPPDPRWRQALPRQHETPAASSMPAASTPPPVPEPGEFRRASGPPVAPDTPVAPSKSVHELPGSVRELPGTAARFGLAAIGWLPIGAAMIVIAGLPGSLVATLPVHAVGVFVLFRAPRVAWAAVIGIVGAVVGLVLGVALASALGIRTASGGIPAVAEALPALAGGLLATWLADWGRFGRPPWERR